MNEVFYAVEYLFEEYTLEIITVCCIVLIGGILITRLLKAKKDKIEEHLDEK